LSVLDNLDVVLAEEGDAVIIAELADGNEGTGLEAVENVTGFLACLDNSGVRGTMTRLVVSMVSPLATRTEGPFEVGVTLVQCFLAAVSK
jgi:hypothetical protein